MAEATSFVPAEKVAFPSERIIKIPRTSEKLPGTTIDFLYVSHAPADAQNVASRMKNADLVLVETTGATKEQRKEIEDFLNGLLKKDSTEQEKAKKWQLDLDQFLHLFVFRSVGSGKKVKLIDVPSDTPELQATDKVWKVGSEIRSLMWDGKVEEAFEKFRLYVNLVAQASRLREDFVFNKISDLLPELREAKNVMVVQGAAHTSVHHRFAKTFPDAKARLNFEPRDLMFNGVTTLARKHVLFPEREIPQAEYRRAFVEDWIFYQGSIEKETVMVEKGWKLEEQTRFARELSLKLTDGEIEKIFSEFSTEYNSALGKDSRRAIGLFLVYKDTVKAIVARWAAQKNTPRPVG